MELKSKPSKNIGIVGLGLIGGSLGLDSKNLDIQFMGLLIEKKLHKKPEKEN